MKGFFYLTSGLLLAATPPALSSQTATRSGYAAGSDSVRIFYEIVGAGPDTVVFIHGTPSTMYSLTRDFSRTVVEASRKEKRRASVVEVPVRLPLPPRLRLAGMRTLLVASFLVEETDLLDANREIVRFLRSELRKRSSLEVADVAPPPVPEQTLEDMIRNSGFWKYLGREYGADIVVSGVLRFDRRDASGFRETDIVNPTTRQKQKTTRFVEQQEFRFEMDVLFFRGLDGSLLYRDRFRRESVYAGTANDPISAFYDLAVRTTEDVSSVVSPAYLTDPRAVFAP